MYTESNASQKVHEHNICNCIITVGELRYGILLGVKEGTHPKNKLFGSFIIETLQL